MYNSLSCDDDDDDDNDIMDEFLFQSIQRYNTLQMFNLENVPHLLLQIDSDSLCVASKRAKGSSELLKLKLPAKLTLPPEEEGLCKENDFKLLSGIYIDNPIYQMGKLQGDNLIFTSEMGTNGLNVYSFNNDRSLGDDNNKVKKLDIIPWLNPDFTVMQESNVICSKCSHKPLILFDVSTGKKVKDINHPLYTFNVFQKEWSKEMDSCSLNNIKCHSLSENVIAVLSTCSGNVFLHDLRTDDVFTTLAGVGEALTNEIWTLSGCNFNKSYLDYFGVLSNTTSFLVYDVRTNGVLFQRKGKNPPVENHQNMKLKFSEREKKFSISGMNSSVEIFRMTENDFEQIFTHHGHCPNNLPSVFVTDHVWLQAGSKEYIVSICDNKTLNCWNCKEQKY